MNNDISAVIESLRGLEHGLSGAARDFSQVAGGELGGDAQFLGKSVVEQCAPKRSFDATIAAVDGGIVSEEYQSAQLVLYRSVCCVFEYKDGKVVRNASRPAGADGYEQSFREAAEESENAQRDSILRLRSEITRATEAVEFFSPTMLFLDGSIFPNPADRPSKDSAAHSEFEALLGEYRALFRACQKNSVTLAGIVKDCKSRVFLDALRKSRAFAQYYSRHSSFLSRTNDSAFLSMALATDTRTGLVPLERQDLPRDLISTRPAITYLKAVPHDRPLRVEFADASKADGACEIICALCKGNQRYAYPAILIEADLRAAMDPRELEVAYARISSKLGVDCVSLRKLRRNERPFR